MPTRNNYNLITGIWRFRVFIALKSGCRSDPTVDVQAIQTDVCNVALTKDRSREPHALKHTSTTYQSSMEPAT